MAEPGVAESWPVEEIPDTDRLFRRVHRNLLKSNGSPSHGAFRDQGGGMSTQQRQKKSEPGYYRQSDIDKFYSDMMKGRYKDEPGVIQATESAIEQAIRDKRVLKGQ